MNIIIYFPSLRVNVMIEGSWVKRHLGLGFREVTALLHQFLRPQQGIGAVLLPPTTFKPFNCCGPTVKYCCGSCYCISSMLSMMFKNDMTITDAGHESEVLNHPASWFVPQVLLSDLLRKHIMEAPHRNAHSLAHAAQLSQALLSLCPFYLEQVYIWAAHGPRRLLLPRVNWAHERNDPIQLTKL